MGTSPKFGSADISPDSLSFPCSTIPDILPLILSTAISLTDTVASSSPVPPAIGLSTFAISPAGFTPLASPPLAWLSAAKLSPISIV